MSEGDSLLEDSWSVSVPRSPTEGQGRGRYRSIISREATLNSYHSEEYKSERTQRVALTLIQLCHLCVWSIACASLLWFPKAVEISNGRRYLRTVLNVLFYNSGWIAGVLTDAFIPKKPILLISVLYLSFGVCGCLVILSTGHLHSTEIIPYPGSSDTPDKTHPLFFTTESTESGYFGILISVAVMMTFTGVLLPTLGADQIQEPYRVRTFLTRFYFVKKCAELLNLAVVMIALELGSEIYHWIIFLPTMATLAIIFVSIIVCSRLTRQVNPDISVIKHGCGILYQAFRRRHIKPVGSSFLSGASSLHGGSYADPEVHEREGLFKLALTLLLLLPVAFSAAPSPYVDNNPNNTGCPMSEPSDDPMHTKYGIQNVVYLSESLSTALCVVLIYVVCHVLTTHDRWRPPTLFERLVAGHITMVLSTVASLIGYYTQICSDYYKMLPSSLVGLTNALIFTTGYELAFIMAPRSMQGTAMGMFYLLDGVASSLNLALEYSLPPVTPQIAEVWVWCSGVGGNLIGMTLLIVLHKRFNLGLDVP